MLIRFEKVKDTHDFVTKFIKVNDKNNVIMRDIIVQDNHVKCIISMRDDNPEYIKMPKEYKNVKFKVLDRNLINKDLGYRNK